MNRTRKIILWATAAAICLLLLFPPWTSRRDGMRYLEWGHAWLYQPYHGEINTGRLLCDLGVVVAVGSVAFVTSARKP